MKKLAFILSMLSSMLSVAYTFAQDAGTSLRRINYNVSIAPEANTLFMQTTKGDVTVKQRLGFSIGFGVGFKLGRRSTIRTGIGYGYRSYVHSLSDLSLPGDIDPQNGFVVNSSMDQRVTFSEVHLPILYQFDFIENRFFIATGFELNSTFAAKSTRLIYFGDKAHDYMQTTHRSMFNVAAVLSLGYKFPISEKLKMSVEPMVKFYATQYIVPQSNLLNYGLRVSLQF